MRFESVLSALGGIVLPLAAAAQTGLAVENGQARLDRLEGQVSAIQEEMTRIRLERSLPAQVSSEYFGQGPAMSKAFFSTLPLSWGATAEFIYTDRESGLGDGAGVTDMRVFLGYRLSSNLTFHSALAMGVAAPGREPSVSPSGVPHLDFALIDWRPREGVVLRSGLVPVPVGERRLRPEPTLYADPLRSRVEEWIVPFDLSSPGAIAMAEGEFWAVNLGIVASPDVARLQNGSFLEGAGSRFRPAQTDPADRFSAVARLETNWRRAEQTGADLTVSGLAGPTSHHARGVAQSSVSVVESHFRIRWGRVHGSMLGALGHLHRAGDFEASFGTRPGSSARGWTSSLHYQLTPDALPIGWPESGIFASAEGIELENAGGAIGTPATDRLGRAARFGFVAKPVPNVTVKLAKQWRLGSDSLDDDLWQIAVGAVF